MVLRLRQRCVFPACVAGACHQRRVGVAMSMIIALTKLPTFRLTVSDVSAVSDNFQDLTTFKIHQLSQYLRTCSSNSQFVELATYRNLEVENFRLLTLKFQLWDFNFEGFHFRRFKFQLWYLNFGDFHFHTLKFQLVSCKTCRLLTSCQSCTQSGIKGSKEVKNFEKSYIPKRNSTSSRLLF